MNEKINITRANIDYYQSNMCPWNTDIGPVRMGPHCWYVGDSWVGVTIVETKDGLVVIDASEFGQMYMVFEAVRKLGYDPQKDIKICLLTHAHLDHCGGMALLQSYSKPVMYMSEFETKWTENPEIYYAELLDEYIPYHVDRVYEYGTPIEHGGYSFLPIFTPGHTEGTTSIFFDDTDDETGVTYRCGLHGGLGQNTLQDSCFKNAEEAKMARELYRKMLHQCMEISVDVNLVNHPGHIGMYEKVPENRKDYSPFVDEQSWLNMLKRMEADLDVLEESTMFK